MIPFSIRKKVATFTQKYDTSHNTVLLVRSLNFLAFKLIVIPFTEKDTVKEHYHEHITINLNTDKCEDFKFKLIKSKHFTYTTSQLADMSLFPKHKKQKDKK